MPKSLLLIRQPSHIRNVTDDEIRVVVPDDLIRSYSETVEVDMRPFQNDTENGYWEDAEGYIIDRARAIREWAEAQGDPVIHYFGLAEAPHVVALGAYVGDERLVRVHDYDRDADSWAWPESEQTVTVTTTGTPADRVEAQGDAVLRVAVSYGIHDADVEAVVPPGRIADVTVQLADPRPTAIRSLADVAAVRQAVREALGKLRELRPGLDRIHLFIAAPVSVCFVVGQELRLRSGVTVVTYRFRSKADGPNNREAITLTPGEASTAARPITDEQRAEAASVREGAWRKAVRDIVRYAATQEQSAQKPVERWYEPLLFGGQLRAPDPFPPLPPIWGVVEGKMAVSDVPLVSTEPYGLPKESWEWQLTDGLLLSQHAAALSADRTLDEALLDRLIRLFVFHESLHEHHALTKYTAAAVGRFANCLERIDYMADLYAALHELDYAIRNDTTGQDLRSDEARHEALKQILDDVLRSHWAFVEDRPVTRWQARHVRRFLNWYWRRVQVVRAPSLDIALRVLSEPPAIEIAGLEHSVGGRRIYVHLDRLDPTTDLSLGLVAENAQLLKVVDSTNANLRELARALSNGDHEAIKTFFQTVYEEARQIDGALPAA
ncbi:MAG TPA: SAVED domain-containing protein [Bacteroidetes bacterium]|nr:SAVED domain-containing protein [Bacteroidota bacterium]